jgi:hypothetical protein
MRITLIAVVAVFATAAVVVDAWPWGKTAGVCDRFVAEVFQNARHVSSAEEAGKRGAAALKKDTASLQNLCKNYLTGKYGLSRCTMMLSQPIIDGRSVRYYVGNEQTRHDICQRVISQLVPQYTMKASRRFDEEDDDEFVAEDDKHEFVGAQRFSDDDEHDEDNDDDVVAIISSQKRKRSNPHVGSCDEFVERALVLAGHPNRQQSSAELNGDKASLLAFCRANIQVAGSDQGALLCMKELTPHSKRRLYYYIQDADTRNTFCNEAATDLRRSVGAVRGDDDADVDLVGSKRSSDEDGDDLCTQFARNAIAEATKEHHGAAGKMTTKILQALSNRKDKMSLIAFCGEQMRTQEWTQCSSACNKKLSEKVHLGLAHSYKITNEYRRGYVCVQACDAMANKPGEEDAPLKPIDMQRLQADFGDWEDDDVVVISASSTQKRKKGSGGGGSGGADDAVYNCDQFVKRAIVLAAHPKRLEVSPELNNDRVDLFAFCEAGIVGVRRDIGARECAKKLARTSLAARRSYYYVKDERTRQAFCDAAAADLGTHVGAQARSGHRLYLDNNDNDEYEEQP